MDFPGVSRSQINKKLVAESYKNFSLVVIADFFAVILYFAFLWNPINNHGMLIAWLLFMLVFNNLARGIFLFNYFRQQKDIRQKRTDFWKQYFIINNILSGVFWAVGGLLFIYVNDPFYRLVIYIFLTGLMGAPAPKLVTFHLSYLGFVIPLWLVMLALAMSFTAPLSIILFVAALLYIALISFSTFDTHRFLVKSVYLELYSSNLLSDLKRSEEYFRNTIENAPIGMAIISPEGYFIHANRTMQDILGYSDQELRQKTILEITHQEDVAMTRDAMNQLIKGNLRISHQEKRYLQKDGNIIWAMVSASLIRDDNGKPVNFIMQMKDVSDRVQNEEKMRKLNEKTMETLNELKLLEHDENLLNKLNRALQICITAEEAYPRINLIAQDLFPDLNGGLAVFNKETKQMETIIQWGKTPLLTKIFIPMDCFAIREGNTNLIEDPEKSIACGHYLKPPSGGSIALPLIVHNELIGVLHLWTEKGEKLSQHQQDIAASFANIVKLALANINLRTSLSELSLHDSLTDLYNRRYLNDILLRELIRLAREKNTLCLAMLDIDNFKNFNDTYGHLAGDEALKLIGKLLRNSFRDSDIAFRFGGEEFVVVLLNTDLKNSFAKMEQFCEKVRKTPIAYKDKQLPAITISIGLAEAPKHGGTIDDILKAADHALYAAKQAGKDQVKAYKNHK